MHSPLRSRVAGALALALATVLPTTSRVATAQTTDESVDALRVDLIRNFDRIGSSPTYEDALFLRILVQSMEAWQGLEIGSANGYGAIHMGIGFERNGGSLLTLDIDPGMTRQCRENVARVRLDDVVTCLEGDPLKLIPTLEGEFDFVFINANAAKGDSLHYLKAIEPRLAPGSVVVAHNPIADPTAMRDYLDHVETGEVYETVIMKTNDGDGMAVSYRKR
jgi:predicted O-methyltransferase YrrM